MSMPSRASDLASVVSKSSGISLLSMLVFSKVPRQASGLASAVKTSSNSNLSSQVCPLLEMLYEINRAGYKTLPYF